MSVRFQMPNGPVTFSLGDYGTLTTVDNNVVVSLGADTKWCLKRHEDQFLITLDSITPEEEECMTLVTEPGPEQNNIVVTHLLRPPSQCQLWTFEHPVQLERIPIGVTARIQSVADTGLSAAIGKEGPGPFIYRNIAGVPNKPGSPDQTWNIDFHCD